MRMRIEMNCLQKFYTSGLRFECTQCGNCCRLPGGKVELIKEEVFEISHALGLDTDSFLEQYCQLDSDKYQLKEQGDGACIFLKDNLCVIYDVRPLQCRTFPFWPENIKSYYRWKQLRQICPGLDKGKLFDLREIQQILNWQKISESNR